MIQDLELSAPSILALFQTSKAERTSFVNDILTRIREGEADPIQVQLQIKAMEEIITSLTSSDEKKNKNIAIAKEYRQILLAAAEKNGKKFDMYNATFSIGEVGTKYDYTVCQDEVWNEMNKQLEILKEKMKEREKFLQNIPDGGIADPENGNMIYKASKSSTTAVSVSLK